MTRESDPDGGGRRREVGRGRPGGRYGRERFGRRRVLARRRTVRRLRCGNEFNIGAYGSDASFRSYKPRRHRRSIFLAVFENREGCSHFRRPDTSAGGRFDRVRSLLTRAVGVCNAGDPPVARLYYICEKRCRRLPNRNVRESRSSPRFSLRRDSRCPAERRTASAGPACTVVGGRWMCNPER